MFQKEQIRSDPRAQMCSAVVGVNIISGSIQAKAP